ncbi:RNA polymerase sigma factor [Sporocytophaga myxococcoides]|uniref:RNA polymerase sigma factor n=1 Tax=Sporocytophaga myxococcoides TaxID=153721 RepID=UPI0003FF0A60|nr:RNA polymerase sigma factor [Sporocytophaga myxococcoides]
MAKKDKEILEFIAQGNDNQALSLIYKYSLPKIRKYILNNNGTEDDVRDIFQDTMVTFYRQVKSGKFNEEFEIDGFLYTVARNLYIKHVTRYSNKNVRNSDTELVIEDASSEDLLQQIIGEEKRVIINNLFAELGGTCAELLKLVVFNNFNLKEIAEKMGFSNEGVAKTKSYKCRQRLIKLLKENHQLVNYLRH